MKSSDKILFTMLWLWVCLLSIAIGVLWLSDRYEGTYDGIPFETQRPHNSIIITYPDRSA